MVAGPGGRVDWAQLPEETVFEGEQLGRWVVAQRAGCPGLEADQQDLLTAIRIEPDLELGAAKAAAEAKPGCRGPTRRAKLTPGQLPQLAQHGVKWA
ncbi:hypothetical protein ACWGI8_26940 [Streptomyces sp. NPDC054841]